MYALTATSVFRNKQSSIHAHTTSFLRRSLSISSSTVVAVARARAAALATAAQRRVATSKAAAAAAMSGNDCATRVMWGFGVGSALGASIGACAQRWWRTVLLLLLLRAPRGKETLNRAPACFHVDVRLCRCYVWHIRRLQAQGKWRSAVWGEPGSQTRARLACMVIYHSLGSPASAAAPLDVTKTSPPLYHCFFTGSRAL